MKKAVYVLISLLLVSACGKSTAGHTYTIPSAEPVPAEKTAEVTESTPTPEVTAAPETEPDVDITGLPSNLVYAQVYNIVSAPEAYVGQTMRINGQYTYYHDEVTGNDYYAVLIADATACCAQGIEFILREGYEYPEEGSDIVVLGVFDTYMEGDQLYCTLRNAVLE